MKCEDALLAGKLLKQLSEIDHCNSGLQWYREPERVLKELEFVVKLDQDSVLTAAHEILDRSRAKVVGQLIDLGVTDIHAPPRRSTRSDLSG